ncbi:DUF4837 family protein [Flavobacteriaceae bacterium]|nr:DUF4837 family protein [Flavobacteriaceae bacterium]
MKFCLKAFCLFLLLSACNTSDNKKVYKPQSSGNINDLSVVIDNILWDSSVGETIRSTIGAPLYGLPQDEPQFSLRQIPSSVFSGFVKNSRLILKVVQGTSAATKFYKDPYASPQRMVLVSGMTNQEISDQIIQNQDKISKAFQTQELEEKQRRTKKSVFKTTSITKQFGINIQFPSIYRIAKQVDDFLWIRRDIKTGTVNLMIYTLPYDDNITKEALAKRVIKVRDSIGKLYIPGPVEGTYMTTEAAYTPFYGNAKVGSLNSFETRSIWQVKDAFMSGPFINYWIEDPVNNRYLVAEGFVFAPSVGKRDYIFELEAIIQSISIKE